jgi:1,4-dihydroxy-2-naphthoyl-CoA synthase
LSDDDFETIRLEQPAEYLASVVLDQPDAMNSINDRMLAELGEAVDQLEVCEEVRAVMIRGAGDDAFSAGRMSNPRVRWTIEAPSNTRVSANAPSVASGSRICPWWRPSTATVWVVVSNSRCVLTSG